MKTYDKNTQQIRAKVGEVFSIELDSIPGAGYQWDADLDTENLELISKEFVPSDPGSIGGSGLEVFKFKPVKTGDSNIRLTYKRPWEAASAESVEMKLHAE